MNGDPLAALRDIQLPPDPGWWPPAPGYLLIGGLLAGLTLLVIAAVAWRRHRRRRAPTLGMRVREELARVRRHFAVHANAQQLLNELSGLLRRAAIARHGSSVASLSGRAWAAHLAKSSPAGCDPELWEYVAVRRYAPGSGVADPEALLLQCRRWLEHVSQ
jgi:hypothetical protein